MAINMRTRKEDILNAYHQVIKINEELNDEKQELKKDLFKVKSNNFKLSDQLTHTLFKFKVERIVSIITMAAMLAVIFFK